MAILCIGGSGAMGENRPKAYIVNSRSARKKMGAIRKGNQVSINAHPLPYRIAPVT
jgi:hypothetical protein